MVAYYYSDVLRVFVWFAWYACDLRVSRALRVVRVLSVFAFQYHEYLALGGCGITCTYLSLCRSIHVELCFCVCCGYDLCFRICVLHCAQGVIARRSGANKVRHSTPYHPTITPAKTMNTTDTQIFKKNWHFINH